MENLYQTQNSQPEDWVAPEIPTSPSIPQIIEDEVNAIISSENVPRKLNLQDLKKPDTEAHQSRTIEAADFAVVNTNEHGKRVKCSKKMLAKLDVKSADNGSVDFAFTADSTVVSKDLSGAGETFHLSKGGHIYSTPLVEEITEKFNLDFTGVTTCSFNNTEYVEINGVIAAIIKMA